MYSTSMHFDLILLWEEHLLGDLACEILLGQHNVVQQVSRTYSSCRSKTLCPEISNSSFFPPPSPLTTTVPSTLFL